MVQPIPNVGSQLDRAICAYLIDGGCGSESNVLPAHCTATKDYPNITVKAFQSQHAPTLSGVEVWQVQIQAKESASNDPKEKNPDAKRVALDNLIGLALALMLQSDDDNSLDFTAKAITSSGRALVAGAVTDIKTWVSPENNTDMADFTLQHLYYKGAVRGDPDSEGSSWVEIRTFEAHVCPLNVD